MADAVFLSFARNKEIGETIVRWWENLSDNKGDRANLRRCDTITSVLFLPAYYKLRRSLVRFGKINDTALACSVGILAHVKNNVTDQSIAKLRVKPIEIGGNPRVSDLRFRRLIQCKGHNDLFGPMIRIIRLLDGTVGVVSLAEDIYYWGDRSRKRWAFDYYSNL